MSNNAAFLADPFEKANTKIAARFGRSLRLDGETEFAHILDGNISPSGAFDLDTSNDLALGAYIAPVPGSLGVDQTIIAKRTDLDETSGIQGWALYITADGHIRFFVDDGAGNTAAASTENATGRQKITTDGFHRFIVATWDRGADILTLWWAPGKRPWQLRQADTADISSVGDASNALPFSIGGATSDGNTFSDAGTLEVGWVAAWDEALDEDTIQALTRFQLPTGDGPNDHDRRLVSLYHWTNFDATDWNRTNANDLVTTGVDRSNYVPGPERFAIIDEFEINPSLGAQPGTAQLTFHRFRPEILSEGFYRIIGRSSAPPLRRIRTTVDATDEPGWSRIASVLGLNDRYVAIERPTGATEAQIWIYDARDAELDSIEGWEPTGKTGTVDKVESRLIVFPDAGASSHCYYLNSNIELVALNIEDPTSPSIDSTISNATEPYGEILWIDQRDNGYLWAWNTDDGRLTSFDLSTPGTPAEDAVLEPSPGVWGTTAQQLFQDRNVLWIPSSTGVGGIDITDPSNPTELDAAGISQTDPDGTDDTSFRVCVVMDNGQVVGLGSHSTDGPQLWLFDTLDNPTLPTPILIDEDDFYDDVFSGHVLEGSAVALFFHESGADHRVTAINLAQPDKPALLATYDLSDYTQDNRGAQSMGQFFGDRMAVAGNSIDRVDLWKFDTGEGFSGLQLDYPVAASAFENPRPTIEHETLYSDLEEDDFEDVAVGATPTDWSRTAGTGDSTHEASDERSLTGAPPGLPAQSLKLALGGADTEVEISKSYTIDAGDRNPGQLFLLSFYHLIRGGILDPDADFAVTIEENGGSANPLTYPLSTGEAAERWFPNEFVYELLESASTELTVSLKLQNSSTRTIHIDSLRLGPGRAANAFVGRITAATGQGSDEGANGEANTYKVEMIDRTFDLNRLPVTASVDAGDPATTVASLLTTYSRSDDQLNADNIDPNLANHDRIAIEDGSEKTLSDVIDEIAQQVGATWYLDYFGSIHMRAVGFIPAPFPMNDVLWGWRDLNDTKDGLDLVTEATVLGDRTAGQPVSATATRDAGESRWGQIAHTFGARGNVRDQSTATALAEFFRDLHGSYHFAGRVTLPAHNGLRPGLLLPAQIEARALDRILMISSARIHGDGARVQADINYALLQESFASMALRSRDESHQRGKRQKPQEFADDMFWTER